MTIKITIRDGNVHSESVNGRNGSFTSRRQEGWVTLPSGEVRRVRIRLARENTGYQPGDYVVGPESFMVSQYGDLQLGSLQLLKASVGVAGSARVAG